MNKFSSFNILQKVLQNARQNASKAIFVVTDGFSNGGDPRPEAEALRRKGVKIYTFGIQNGNVRELYDMASEPKNESCYILDSFKELEALSRRALHEGEFVLMYITLPHKNENSSICLIQYPVSLGHLSMEENKQGKYSKISVEIQSGFHSFVNISSRVCSL